MLLLKKIKNKFCFVTNLMITRNSTAEHIDIDLMKRTKKLAFYLINLKMPKVDLNLSSSEKHILIKKKRWIEFASPNRNENTSYNISEFDRFGSFEDTYVLLLDWKNNKYIHSWSVSYILWF